MTGPHSYNEVYDSVGISTPLESSPVFSFQIKLFAILQRQIIWLELSYSRPSSASLVSVDLIISGCQPPTPPGRRVHLDHLNPIVQTVFWAPLRLHVTVRDLCGSHNAKMGNAQNVFGEKQKWLFNCLIRCHEAQGSPGGFQGVVKMSLLILIENQKSHFCPFSAF